MFENTGSVNFAKYGTFSIRYIIITPLWQEKVRSSLHYHITMLFFSCAFSQDALASFDFLNKRNSIAVKPDLDRVVEQDIQHPNLELITIQKDTEIRWGSHTCGFFIFHSKCIRWSRNRNSDLNTAPWLWILVPLWLIVMKCETISLMWVDVNCVNRLFSREEEQFHFSLQDFKCVAVLGRGHFGKVRFHFSV